MSAPSEDEEQEERRDDGWLDVLGDIVRRILPFGLVIVVVMLIINAVFAAFSINREVRAGSNKDPSGSKESR